MLRVDKKSQKEWMRYEEKDDDDALSDKQSLDGNGN